MPQIFISYKRGDEDKRDEVISIINPPYHGWYDKKDITGRWQPDIEDALRDSLICLVIVTNKVFESDWVLFEVAFAKGFGLDIVPWFAEKIEDSHKEKALYKLLSDMNIAYNLPDLISEIEKVQSVDLSDDINDMIFRNTLRLRTLIHIGCAYVVQKDLASGEKWFDKALEEIMNLKWIPYTDFSNRHKRIYKKIKTYFHGFKEKVTYVWQQIHAFPSNLKNSTLYKDNAKLIEYLREIDKYIEDNLNRKYHPQFLLNLSYIGEDYGDALFIPLRPDEYGLTQEELDLVPFLVVYRFL